MTLESEHRPVGKRTYYFNEHRRRAVIESYVRRPGGKVIEPELRLGYKPNVSFSTPFGDGPVHGANSVYVVEQGVDDEILTIRTAKWITMHHNCGWGHNGKFDKALTTPQPLATIPFEIVVDKLWDTNFHLSVTSGDRLGITVLSYGQPVPGATVSLSSEKGWSKSAVTDKEGRVTIQMIRDYYPPLWSQFKGPTGANFYLPHNIMRSKRQLQRGQLPPRTLHYHPSMAIFTLIKRLRILCIWSGSWAAWHDCKRFRSLYLSGTSQKTIQGDQFLMNKLRVAVNSADISRFRFYFQIVSFFLLIYGGYLAINIGDRLPTFACVFADARGGSCYLMGFQHQMSTPLDKMFTGRGIGILIGFFIFIGFFILFNKAWCGYVCPLGTIQDWITKFRTKTGIRYSTYSAPTFNKLKNIKYVLLVLLILIPMGIGNSIAGLPKISHDFGVPFCMICPGRTVLPLFNGDISQVAVSNSRPNFKLLKTLTM